jgi:cation diffusion facilitator CzcD-associated flavoprotein CzcO
VFHKEHSPHLHGWRIHRAALTMSRASRIKRRYDAQMSGGTKSPVGAGAERDVVIVGAGFSGLYMLHRLRQLGFDVELLEAADGVGGTWYWNRYPGARCDIESLQYSYTCLPELDQELEWSERYATQPEILRYLNLVADRLSLRPFIRLSTRVTAVTFDEQHEVWEIESAQGERLTARHLVLATGCLSAPRRPELRGLERFKGRILQTSEWPHEEVTFNGERVGVIGTGSSGIQSIPIIARQASRLFVFQRTPCFSVPAHNGPIDPSYRAWFKANARELRERGRRSMAGIVTRQIEEVPAALTVSAEERTRRYEAAWAKGGLDFMNTFADLFVNQEANATAIEFLHEKVRGTVQDTQVAERLLPRGYPAFAKRLCVDTDYHRTFNRSHVRLVDIARHPIRELTETGLRTDDAHYELDSIVFATGFDAMTGAVNAMDIRGRSGLRLKEKWAAGPRTYLGLAVAGFPNLFLITGPGSPSVISNMVVSIEQHVEWIAGCLDSLRRRGVRSIEANETAEAAWVDHVREVAAMTLFPQASSWYTGANIPGKPRIFMAYVGGVGTYRHKCDEVAREGYVGFTLANGS